MNLFPIFLAAVFSVPALGLSIPKGTVPPSPPANGTISRTLPTGETPMSCNGEYHVTSKSGMINENSRWQYFHVYPNPNDYSDQERSVIDDAMYRMSQAVPCIRFGIWPRDSNPTGDYVHIKKTGTGCNSYVGKTSMASQSQGQQLSLDNDCVHVSTAMHEIMHALGGSHEHQRIDRDDFINVHWNNIERQNQQWFAKDDTRTYSTFNVAFNVKSVMHYPSDFFSSNGGPTMTKKDGSRIPFNFELQATDVELLRKMYKC